MGPASDAPQRGQPLAEPARIRRQQARQPDARRFSHSYLLLSWTAKGAIGAAQALRDGHSVEIELVALDVLHHDARLVVVIGRQ
jgi:hypothetical protein